MKEIYFFKLGRAKTCSELSLKTLYMLVQDVLFNTFKFNSRDRKPPLIGISVMLL